LDIAGPGGSSSAPPNTRPNDNSGPVIIKRKIPNFLTGKIASDERVIFFPTVGGRINETHWSAHIHGWIFEPETESRKRKVAIRGLGKVLDVKTDTEGGELL
jgi:hypothetical protein